MSLINDYLKKTQNEAPHPDQPGDVPPVLKSGGKGGGGKLALRIAVIAVLGVIAGVAYYRFQPSGQKTSPPPNLVASLGESRVHYPGRSKPSAPAPTTSIAEEPLPAAGALTSVPAKEASKVTPAENRAPVDKPAPAGNRALATEPQPSAAIETRPEVEKIAVPEPEEASQTTPASPAVTIAPIKRTEKPETVEEVDLNHYFQIGLIAQKDGDFREAKRFYQEVLAQDPAHVGALTNLAAVYIHQKRTSDAEQTLQKILAIDPNNTKALVNLGMINLTLNQREQAEMRFQEALRIDPREDTALINLAFLANQAGDSALAEKYYKDILSLTPQNSAVLLAYASLLERNSRIAEALSCYQKSLEVPAVTENEQLHRQVQERVNLLRYYYSAQR